MAEHQNREESFLPGAPHGAPPAADPTRYAEGSVYTSLAGFFLPWPLFVWGNVAGPSWLLWAAVLLMLLGPVGIVLAAVAQTRPHVRWTDTTAWIGMGVGLLDVAVYGIYLGATFGLW